MSTPNARQADLATLFGHKQPWVARMQARTIDPMPRDLDGARAWGIRNGHLAPASPSAPLFAPQPPAASVPAIPVRSLEEQDLRLKGARADLLEFERAVRSGEYLKRAEVEQREVAIASEFRNVACEYPLRARAILERHIPDAAVVDRIITDLQPLAAELLNKADATQALAGKTRDEVRSILHGHVESLLEAIL